MLQNLTQRNFINIHATVFICNRLPELDVQKEGAPAAGSPQDQQWPCLMQEMEHINLQQEQFYVKTNPQKMTCIVWFPVSPVFFDPAMVESNHRLVFTEQN